MFIIASKLNLRRTTLESYLYQVLYTEITLQINNLVRMLDIMHPPCMINAKIFLLTNQFQLKLLIHSQSNSLFNSICR